MAPSSGRYLAQADLLGTVEHMQRDLDGGIQPTVMKPIVPLTNGILLDLYRFSKLAESAGRRVVDLLHALGYEAKSTCPKEQEKMEPSWREADRDGAKESQEGKANKASCNDSQ